MRGYLCDILESMRGFIIFLVIVAGIFFGVGETRGWLVGVVGNTPVFAYKTDGSISATRRLLNTDEFTFAVSGEVTKGSVIVYVTYERPQSFQNQSQRALAESIEYEQPFRKGEPINIEETVGKGQGVYKVRLDFTNGSGKFDVTLPSAGQL